MKSYARLRLSLVSAAVAAAIAAPVAAQEVQQAREREGDKLKGVLLERVNRMEALLAWVKPKIPRLVAAYQERLVSRMRDAGVEVEEDRIRQELVRF